MSSFSTRAVHAGRSDFTALGVHAPPIDLSTTAPLSDIGAGGDSYENLATGGTLQPGDSTVYRRLWNPTVARFEEAVATLESPLEMQGTVSDRGIEGVAFATGMAGMSAVLISRVRIGKPHVVAVRPLYGGTDHLLKAGILGTQVTYARPEEVAGAITPDTGLIVVESPANPNLQLLDISQIVQMANGVPVLVDNTFATPVLQRPLSLGATYSFHSATKYIGGHGDAMCGIIICKSEDAIPLRQIRAITGALLDPFSAFLLHRGIQTLPIRMREQQSNAQALAQFFTKVPIVSKVHFPGLPGGDPHGLIGKQMAGPGAMISIELDGGIASAAVFCRNLRLVTHAVSLGGTDTLIQHPAALTHRPVEDSAKPPTGLLRISVGIEGIEDLLEDFEGAFNALVNS